VIEGETNGIRVVIFDSLVGDGRWAGYCTMVATESTESLFKSCSSGEKIAQRTGWSALYRIPFLAIPPWTLSATRIDALLSDL
jgi:hypothetical protein